MTDEFAERMKSYEGAEAQRRLLPLVPAMARLDGRAFSKFTQGLTRPFDPGFTKLMQAVTKKLVLESGALVGYTQSDEITLAWHSTTWKARIFFEGRVQKMVSVLASIATLELNRRLAEYLSPEYADKEPAFDCRVWSVPTLEEAANVFVWRQIDAGKNSISMAAQHLYPHAELHGKSGSEMQEMLHAKGINWNNYPFEVKRGIFCCRETVKRKLSVAELAELPPLHEARRNPELEFERTQLAFRDLWLTRIANRCEVLFSGAAPIAIP